MYKYAHRCCEHDFRDSVTHVRGCGDVYIYTRSKLKLFQIRPANEGKVYKLTNALARVTRRCWRSIYDFMYKSKKSLPFLSLKEITPSAESLLDLVLDVHLYRIRIGINTAQCLNVTETFLLILGISMRI